MSNRAASSCCRPTIATYPGERVTISSSPPAGASDLRRRETCTRSETLADSGGSPSQRSSIRRATETTRPASSNSSARRARSFEAPSSSVRPSWTTSSGPRMRNSMLRILQGARFSRISLRLQALRGADDHHVAAGLMGDAVRDAAQEEAAGAGHALVADDDDVGVLLLGDAQDHVRGRAGAGMGLQVEVGPRDGQRALERVLGLLPKVAVEPDGVECRAGRGEHADRGVDARRSVRVDDVETGTEDAREFR